jgi:hypothetical protein
MKPTQNTTFSYTEMGRGHPVELLACAIASQEGFWVEDSIPQMRNNPGDLDYAGQIGARLPMPVGLPDPAIAVFASKALGVTALFRQIWLQVAEGQTVRQIVAQWAPPNENNTSAYLQDILQWTGLPADTPVLELLPPLVRLN